MILRSRPQNPWPPSERVRSGDETIKGDVPWGRTRDKLQVWLVAYAYIIYTAMLSNDDTYQLVGEERWWSFSLLAFPSIITHLICSAPVQIHNDYLPN